MINSKLISLVSTFSRKELKEFQLFVDSPYFNKEKSISKFVSEIRKVYHYSTEKKLSKEKIYKEVYPGRAYNDELMRNIISRTLKLAEEFVTIREFQTTKNFNMFFKMRALADRNQPYHFEKARRDTKRIIDENPYKDSEHYFVSLTYEDEIRRFTLQTRSSYFIKDDNIQKITDNGIYYSTVELLKLYAVMINQKKHIQDINFDFGFMHKLLEYYEENPGFFKDVPYAHLYYNSIKLFLTEEEKYFQNVHKVTVKNYDALNDIDRKNAYVVMVNYCSERINKGDLSYLRKRFGLYKEIIDNGAHYEGLPYISHIFYITVASTAIKIGSLRWALNFIEKYRNELESEHRENSYFFCIAEYHLKSGSYELALESLAKVQRVAHDYKARTYHLILKIFYSLCMEESFYREIENYKSFLMTSKVVSRRERELGLSFIRLTKNLFDIKHKKIFGKKYDVSSLRKKVLDNKYIIDKFWLLEKLTELEGDDEPEDRSLKNREENKK